MGYEIEKKFSISLSEIDILKNYDCKYKDDFYIYSASSITNPKNNTIMFANKNFDASNLSECIIVIKNCMHIENRKNNIVIKVDNPRLEYSKILNYIVSKKHINKNFCVSSNGYYRGENVEIGKNTIIEPFVFIDDNVVIGQNCYIKSGAKIRQYTKIGDGCVIKENCVIGSSGFGLEKDNVGNVYKIPHLGGVIIKNNVEIGSLASIASGTIEPTIIEENVHIDDCVFIAHNCHIGKSTFIIANAEISGSVNIGKNCWIGPNASIIQKVKIGDNSTVGIGSVVTKTVDENSIVAGNPADDIEYIRTKRSMDKEMVFNFKQKKL